MSEDLRFYTGASMSPTFRPGDCIVFERLDPRALRRGDVIVFRSGGPGGPDVVHRITAVRTDGLEVRGDGCRSADRGTVPLDDVLGRVCRIEREGRSLPVPGGCGGHLWSRMVSVCGPLRRITAPFYRLLRRTGIARLIWRPSIRALRFETDGGAVLRLVCRGRLVGKWCPDSDTLLLKKPWDLFLTAEDCRSQLKVSAESPNIRL